jgi:hypothetical protein
MAARTPQRKDSRNQQGYQRQTRSYMCAFLPFLCRRASCKAATETTVEIPATGKKSFELSISTTKKTLAFSLSKKILAEGRQCRNYSSISKFFVSITQCYDHHRGAGHCQSFLGVFITSYVLTLDPPN